MALGDGSMLPLVDRDTPVVNKLLERGSGKHLGRALGKIVGMGMLADPQDEEMEQKANNLLEGFGRGLADELEVADEAIDAQQIRVLGNFLFGSDVDEFLTNEAKKELGIGAIPSGEPEVEEGESDESEDDSESDADSDEETDGPTFS